MIEYILTNGTLPGFEERLEESMKTWPTLKEDRIVYRGQGHSKKGIKKITNAPPSELLAGVRPVLSTSVMKDHIAKHFTNTTKSPGCCLFEIILKKGIRYFDFNSIPFKSIKYDDIDNFKKFKITIDEEGKIWPHNKMPLAVLYNYLVKKKTEEQEVLVDARQGNFVPVDSRIEDIDGIPMTVYKVIYEPFGTGGKRGKTRRRKTIRRSLLFLKKTKKRSGSWRV